MVGQALGELTVEKLSTYTTGRGSSLDWLEYRREEQKSQQRAFGLRFECFSHIQLTWVTLSFFNYKEWASVGKD